jgi:hypothetical protein
MASSNFSTLKFKLEFNCFNDFSIFGNSTFGQRFHVLTSLLSYFTWSNLIEIIKCSIQCEVKSPSPIRKILPMMKFFISSRKKRLYNILRDYIGCFATKLELKRWYQNLTESSKTYVKTKSKKNHRCWFWMFEIPLFSYVKIPPRFVSQTVGNVFRPLRWYFVHCFYFLQTLLRKHYFPNFPSIFSKHVNILENSRDTLYY